MNDCKRKFARNAVYRKEENTPNGFSRTQLSVRGVYTCVCGGNHSQVWGRASMKHPWPRIHGVPAYNYWGSSHVLRQGMLGVNHDPDVLQGDLEHFGLAATIGEISTAHITPSTNDWLIANVKTSDLNYSVVEGTGFIFIVPPAEDIDPQGFIPVPELELILRWASQRGYSYLRLNSEGPVNQNLKTWEW